MNSAPHITIIGAGVMGSGIAHAFASHGCPVILCDISQDRLDSAQRALQASTGSMHKSGLLTPAEHHALHERISMTTNLHSAFSRADIVVEAVSESVDTKTSVFLQIAELAPDDTTIWSNTSTLDIFNFAPPEIQTRLLIAHWFAPAHILPLVELVKGDRTAEPHITRTTQLLDEMGKTPILLDRYVPGFLINRLLRALGREAFYLIDNGYITAEKLDMAVKGSLAPRMLALGVMQRYDFTGLDLSAQNFKNAEFVDAPVDLAPRALLNHVEKGELGIKTGKGFYDYGSMTMEQAAEKRDQLLLQIITACQSLITAERGV